jgi:hypothetical protein
VNKFEVGCDPEFAVLDKTGNLVDVQNLGHEGVVGYDHGGDCAELRPAQARGLWTLIKRLQVLIAPPYPSLKPFYQQRWRAGAYYRSTDGETVALGGHVHFNIHRSLFPPLALSALDRVTNVLERCDILPRGECVVRRTQTLYGKWAQIRHDTPDQHVEYRTMASWLFSPWISFLCLTLAKLAVVDPPGVTFNNDSGPREIIEFLERFRGKDQNVDRLLAKLERDRTWLVVKPDDDIKEAWAKPLGR